MYTGLSSRAQSSAADDPTASPLPWMREAQGSTSFQTQRLACGSVERPGKRSCTSASAGSSRSTARTVGMVVARKGGLRECPSCVRRGLPTC